MPETNKAVSSLAGQQTYTVAGLMSGTSLDGVDIACCTFTQANNIWIYKILNAATISYPNAWKARLSTIHLSSAAQLAETHFAYGRYLGQLTRQFLDEHHLRPDFVASHGHTIFHQPEIGLCLQLGNGASLAAAARLPVVCDFRTLDIALGGQGAPLVPIGDRLLFGQYTFCLNLGGIANISAVYKGSQLAYDVCACNLALNYLAAQLGLEYDQDGNTARSGTLNQSLLAALNQPIYYAAPAPKSLGREWVEEHVIRLLHGSGLSVEDQLCTTCHHIAQQVAASVKDLLKQNPTANATLLVTGGGAFNGFLIELFKQYLHGQAEVVVPDAGVVNFKEALIFALLGVLRWRTEVNCLSSVTGASADNVGGAIYWHQ